MQMRVSMSRVGVGRGRGRTVSYLAGPGRGGSVPKIFVRFVTLLLAKNSGYSVAANVERLI